MKVGTDGVLLGAWAPIREARRILDIGTGSGLVSLMIAQRSARIGSRVSAIDVDSNAAAQAVENFQDSPWPQRLPEAVETVHVSLQQYAIERTNDKVDLAVSNPPFFEPAFQTESSARSTARTTKTLGHRSLFEHAQTVLKNNGRFCLILPWEQAQSTIKIASSSGFVLWGRTDVRPTPKSRLKRVLFEFGKEPSSDGPVLDEIVIEESRHEYSKAYERLTKEFHLRYAKTRPKR